MNYQWVNQEHSLIRCFDDESHVTLVKAKSEKGRAIQRLYDIEPAPDDRLQRLAETARAKRNKLLAESDWTQVADAPGPKQKWKAYRKALRDLPKQEGFPETIDWPQRPA